MNNYYDILGIREDSTSEEIKKAYRKLSKEHHPDMGGDPEKFKNLSEAYGILSDTQKRNNYDNRRKNPFFGSGMDTDQMFEQFFARGGQGQNTNVENLNANVEVTLEEINEGVKKTIRFNRVVIDRHKKMSVCPSCGGRGTINLMGPFKTRCGNCNGSGRIHQYKKVVTEVNFGGTLEYGSDSLTELTLKLRYDWARLDTAAEGSARAQGGNTFFQV